MMKPMVSLNTLQFSRSHGVDVELRHALPNGWMLECRSLDYVVRGMATDGWRHQLWKVVEFLSFDELVVLRASDWPDSSRCYEFISAMKNGVAYRVYFVLDDG